MALTQPEHTTDNYALWAHNDGSITLHVYGLVSLASVMEDPLVADAFTHNENIYFIPYNDVNDFAQRRDTNKLKTVTLVADTEIRQKIVMDFRT